MSAIRFIRVEDGARDHLGIEFDEPEGGSYVELVASDLKLDWSDFEDSLSEILARRTLTPTAIEVPVFPPLDVFIRHVYRQMPIEGDPDGSARLPFEDARDSNTPAFQQAVTIASIASGALREIFQPAVETG